MTVLIKRYANRKLYNTDTSRYITLKGIAELIERGEEVTLVPMLIMNGELDDNVRPAVQQKFATTYEAAGGHCELQIYENSTHRWTAEEGPLTDRAREMVRQFVARHLGS